MSDAKLASGGDGVVQERGRAMMRAGNRRRGQDEAAIAREQATPGIALKLVPDFVGAQGQRHELAALADGLAGDASFSVRGAEVVWRVEAINPDDADAALR